MAKILLIEDEPLVIRLYEKSLKYGKHEVVSAMNGSEGLKKMRESKPEIVLLDVMMPDMNGMQVLEEMSKDPELKDIPVIMLTNLSGKHDAELAIEKGATEYWVKKDTRPQELGDRVNEILGEEKAEASK